ncbi:MerR family transcriptional regulator [Streptomyces sp. BH097]|uniref:MerR family transcriptional regulator n=1 Tax=unclassified Streptomyces TaxID=2593676 RepID=UPI003BB69636
MTATDQVADGSQLTIQQVSRLSGLSEPTLRYYEKIGLIDAVDRDESSGHRRYGSAVVETIEALACLRSTGMSVRDMRTYLLHLDSRDAPRLRELFRVNAERVTQEIDRMRVRQQYLDLKADLWDARDRGDTAAEDRAITALTAITADLTGAATP